MSVRRRARAEVTARREKRQKYVADIDRMKAELLELFRNIASQEAAIESAQKSAEDVERIAQRQWHGAQKP